MSDSDSFINEVTEEVRRDKLFALIRRWGWIVVLLIVGIVAYAAYSEYRRAQNTNAAQVFGDALIAALDVQDAQTRYDALTQIETSDQNRQIILDLLQAAALVDAGQSSQAAGLLRVAAQAPDLSRHYRDLALLQAEILDPSDLSEAELTLGILSEPGAPYAALAQEQLALAYLRAGNGGRAVEILRSLQDNAAAQPTLRQRVGQTILAIESGAVLASESAEILGDDDAILSLTPTPNDNGPSDNDL